MPTVPLNESDSPLDEILGQYMVRIDRGEQVDREEFIAQHPAVAVELREYFANVDALGEIAQHAESETMHRGIADVPGIGETIRYFGDYALLEKIAQGGMGIVYKARQRSLNRLVAVKMILAGQLASQQEVDRFRREAKIAANLKHPNIVAIHEVGEHEGQQFFSMDYIEGNSLAEMVRENPLPSKKAAEYIKQVAEAVHYAHQCGTLHRDLKPSNILVDGNDEPHVTDFGLARQLESGSELTVSGAVMGSPNYMPPEQAEGRLNEVEPRSDVYSLGAALYDLLTGRPPFWAETPAATVAQVITSDPAPPRRVNSAIDRDLETICLKCMEKEPHRRYESAAALTNDLDRYLTGRPILARPIGPTARLWRWARRNRMVAALAGALMCALLVGVTFAVVADQRRQKLAHVDREAFRETEFILESAFRARKKGELGWAMDFFQLAAQRGHFQTPAIRLAILDAYNAENRYDLIRPEVERLGQLTNLGKERGAVLLWKAELELLDGNSARAIEHIRESLNSKLSETDKAYADGLLANDCRDAVGHFRRVLVLAEYHQRANLRLAWNYLLLGKRDEARVLLLRQSTLCPEDPNAMILLAMVEAFDGNVEVARRRLESNQHLHPDQRDIVVKLFQQLDEFNRFVNDLTRTVEANPAWEILQLIETAQPLCLPPSRDDRIPTATITIRFPLPLQKRYRDLVAADKAYEQEENDHRLVDVLEEMVKVHPEGTLHFLLGQLHFVAGRFEQAEKAYGTVKDADAILPAVKKEASFSTMMAQVAQGFGQNEQKLQNAVDTIRERLKSGPLSRLHSKYAVMGLLRAKEYDLAEFVLRQAIAREPDDTQLLGQLVDVAFDGQDYASAIRQANDILQHNPKNEHALQRRSEAIAELREMVERLGGTDTEAEDDSGNTTK